jgi:phosphatidylglycerophosphate synthase
MTFLDRIAAQFSRYDERNLKILFWLISLLLVPVFTKNYWYPVSLLTMLLMLPFGSAADKYAGLVFFVEAGICFFFAIMTMIQLWRMLKKHCLQN